MHPLDAAVLVAAPPTLYRQGLLTTLRDHWPRLALTLTPDAYSLPTLLQQQAFGLVVVDSDLLGPSPADLLAQMQATRRRQPVLILTAQRLSTDCCQESLSSDLVLCLPRHAAPQDLITTISPWLNGTAGGTAPLPRPQHRPVAPPTPFSRRELDVLRLVVGDCCNQEIAQQLCLSVRTVESHRRALLQKTGARTLVGLVVQAVREGWVLT